MTFWNALEPYQTLVAGLFGFAGVMGTLWFNAKTARDQRREERDHERKALRVALIAELTINRSALENGIERLEAERADPDEYLYVTTNIMNSVYQEFIPRIGLLSDEEVDKVMETYLTLESGNANLYLLGTPDPSNPHHIKVTSKFRFTLAGMHRGLLSMIDGALEALHKARDHG